MRPTAAAQSALSDAVRLVSRRLHLLRLHKRVEASGNLLGQVVPDRIDVEGELDLVASGCGTVLDPDAQGVVIDFRLLSSEAGQLLAFRGSPKIIDVSRRRHVDSDGATSAAEIAIDPRNPDVIYAGANLVIDCDALQAWTPGTQAMMPGPNPDGTYG